MVVVHFPVDFVASETQDDLHLIVTGQVLWYLMITI